MPTITVDEWVQKTEKRMMAVYKESTQRLVAMIQSRVPVDTGFARASLRASLTEMPKIVTTASKPTTGKNSVPYDATSVAVVIASAKLGDKIYLGWTANYIESLERGHSRQAPAGFLRVSLLEWPRIVAETTDAAKARAAG